jgi:L-fuculose-phosphate aldolase
MNQIGSVDVSGAAASAREQVVNACHRLARRGLVTGTAGNVSVRVGELVAVTATGVDLATADDAAVTFVDLAGDVRHGALRPTSELALHLGIYRHTDAGAVVHSHSAAATAVSVVLDELPCLHYQQLLLGGPIRVAPFAAFGTAEIATLTLEALADRRAAILAHHGAVTIGSSLDEALHNTELLEWVCRLFIDASAVGVPRSLLADQIAAVISSAARNRYGTPQHLEETGR